MKRILLIGGGGFVGRPLERKLLSSGWDVSSLALEPAGDGDAAVHRMKGNREDPTLLPELARQGFNAVVDLVAYLPRQTRALVSAFAGRTVRIVHLSTVAVYDRIHLARTSEAEAPTCVETDSSYRSGKAGCERVLEAAARDGLDHAIVRCPPVIGPGDRSSREGYILDRLLRTGKVRIPSPADGIAHMVHVEDLADMLAFCAEAPEAAGRSYHVAMDPCPTLLEHVRAIAAVAHIPNPRLESLDAEAAVRAGFRIAGFPYPFCGPGRLDISAARSLGFDPRPHASAVAETIAWLQSLQPGQRPMWPGRGTMQSLLAGTHPRLHSGVESRFAAGDSIAVTGRETVLDALTGPDGSPLELRAWEECPPDPEAHSGPPVVAAPRELLEKLGKNTAGPKSGGELVAAIEKLPGTGEFALFVSEPRPSQAYAHDSSAGRIRILPFHPGALAKPAEPGATLLETRSRTGSEAFALWASEMSVGTKDGAAIQALEQIRLIDEPSCASVSPWAFAFRAARLLRRAGMEGQSRIVLIERIERDESEDDEVVLLAEAGGRRFLVIPDEDRLFEIEAAGPPALGFRGDRPRKEHRKAQMEVE